MAQRTMIYRSNMVIFQCKLLHDQRVNIKYPVNPTNNLIIVDKSHDKSPHGEITRAFREKKKKNNPSCRLASAGLRHLVKQSASDQARKSHVPLKIPVVGPGHVFFFTEIPCVTMRKRSIFTSHVLMILMVEYHVESHISMIYDDVWWLNPPKSHCFCICWMMTSPSLIFHQETVQARDRSDPWRPHDTARCYATWLRWLVPPPGSQKHEDGNCTLW